MLICLPIAVMIVEPSGIRVISNVSTCSWNNVQNPYDFIVIFEVVFALEYQPLQMDNYIKIITRDVCSYSHNSSSP